MKIPSIDKFCEKDQKLIREVNRKWMAKYRKNKKVVATSKALSSTPKKVANRGLK